jgi:glycerol-3-phosphate dehydrogenase
MTERFDLAVIGAGVVGCAIARRAALEGARVVVLEKAWDVLDGASKGNSGILHTGFDAPEGSLEQACVAAGHAEYLAIRDRLNLPLLETGALVLAWTAEEADRLPALMAQAAANGVAVEPLTAAQARALEPGLAEGVVAAFRVPGEHVIDPWSAPHAYLAQALTNGAALMRGAEATGGAWEGDGWRLDTAQGPVRARAVVNAAGLWGDVVERRLLGSAAFEIRPRKGQFVVFDKAAFGLARHILLPVPSETTKGVVVCRTAWGNLLVGPTAEEQESREDASTDAATLAALIARGAAILPGLRGMGVTATYAGLRPATEEKHYRIRRVPERNWVTVGGVRSTGLSAALGLARHVWGLLALETAPPAEPAWPAAPLIAETGPRDWTRPGHGGIVCHCEMVTRREIEAALAGPMAARTFAGLKRRTRCAMGRCQGFACMAELAALTRGRLREPLAEPLG